MASEAHPLWRLALRSKAQWGYSPEFMSACSDELRVPIEWIDAGNVFVGRLGERVVGFYSLLHHSHEEVELCHLFVEPEVTSRGVGRGLFEAALDEASRRAYRRLLIQSDPYAVGFYRRLGAVVVGQKESQSVKDRFLPLLVVELEDRYRRRPVGAIKRPDGDVSEPSRG